MVDGRGKRGVLEFLEPFGHLNCRPDHTPEAGDGEAVGEGVEGMAFAEPALSEADPCAGAEAARQEVTPRGRQVVAAPLPYRLEQIAVHDDGGGVGIDEAVSD